MGTGDYPAELLAGCSGTSLHLWRVSNVNSSPPVPNSHPGQQPLEVVAWNRNNKVVAGARADGSVSLSYSNGEAMSVLNRPAGSSAIVTPTALAWASGSKRLAVAGRSGAIGVHDMTNKACTTVHLPEPIAALQYHPADRFLAVCGGASATLLDRDLRPVGQLTPEPGMAPATCMHLDSSSACLTLGHADGSLNVWDLPSRRTVAASQALGRGGICSVSSPAGDPSSVYAAAKDGSVWCLDRRTPGSKPAALVRLGTPLTAFDLKEDHSIFAAGTAEGIVYLYDPRAPAGPLAALSSGSRRPITGLHWQHCYHSPPSRAGNDGRAGQETRSARPSDIASSGKAPTNTAGQSGTALGPSSRRPDALPGLPADSVAAAGVCTSHSTLANLGGAGHVGGQPTGPSDHAATSGTEASRAVDAALCREAAGARAASGAAAAGLAHPESLNVTPFVGFRHGVGPAGSTAPSAGAAALEDIRRRLPLAIGSRWGTEAGQDRAAATPAPQVTAREWSEGPRREAAREGGDAGSAGGAHGPRPHTSEPTSSTASANANPALQRAPSGARLSSPAKSSPGTDSGKKGADTAQEGWRIPAVARDSPPRSFRPGREAAEGPGSPDGSNESVRPMEEDSLLGTAPAQGAAAGSPLRRQPPPPLASVSRDDLLALHLDMLNQFQAQRIHMEELLKEMGSRQDQLSAELSSLRQQLGSLLTQRNDLRWL
uniref:Protein NEDD1 n=1 Tax=Auxenochlorella protothecoides TaxID=3075 RepID=A0A1D2A5G7_AUXPR